ncbi:MAG: YciI family protein [Betaproteobacteria bacterium]|nr:MAG: YciI family protein [Betaproteobacteria bacterium]
MKFMILVKATKDSEAGVMPTEKLFADMAAYHEELVKAGILVDASGLQRSEKGWRIRYSGNKRTVVDGPFTETKDLVAGYTVINVKSREEALEWTKRFPNPSIDGGAAEIEVRQYFELEDFGDSPSIERFRKMGVGE